MLILIVYREKFSGDTLYTTKIRTLKRLNKSSSILKNK